MLKSQQLSAIKALCPVMERYRVTKKTESVICKIRNKISHHMAPKRVLKTLAAYQSLLNSRHLRRDLFSLR